MIIRQSLVSVAARLPGSQGKLPIVPFCREQRQRGLIVGGRITPDLPTNENPGARRRPPANKTSRPATRSVYCLVIARFSRCSGLIRWSWLSLPTSICTQWIFPLKTLLLVL